MRRPLPIPRGRPNKRETPQLLFFSASREKTFLLGILFLTLLWLNTSCPVLANSVNPDQLASEEAN